MGWFDHRVQGPSVQFWADNSSPEANRTTRLRKRIQTRFMLCDLTRADARKSLVLTKVN